MGDWRDGRPHGNGEKTWPDGKRYKGEFYGGQPFGKGTKISPEGEEVPGYWVGGMFFEGEPQEGVIELQRSKLEHAKIIHEEMNNSLDEDSEPVELATSYYNDG